MYAGGTLAPDIPSSLDPGQSARHPRRAGRLSCVEPIMPLMTVNRSARTVAWLLGLLACGLFAGALYWGAMTAHAAELQEAQAAVQNMANALARQTNSSLRVAHALLNDISAVARNNAHHIGSLDLAAQLQGQTALFEEIDTMALFDERGMLVGSWPMRRVRSRNASGEAFFRHARQGGRVPAIGAPIRSPVTGEMIIPVFRSCVIDGHLGVAMVGLKVTYFSALFDSFDIRDQGALVLATTEGVMLLRRPYDARFLGKSMQDIPIYRDYAAHARSGEATLVSAQDGVERIHYFQRIADYPLFVVAALARDEVLTDWQHNLALLMSIALSAALTIGLLVARLQGMLIYREKAEQEIDAANRALAQSNEKLARQALLDGMTGIANRRALDTDTRHAIQSASRSSSSLALIMFDVDHFKHFNDLYGHIQGDACLKEIAGVLQQMQKRNGDLAARYGGEEFAILLPHADIHGARQVAEDALAAVRTLRIAHQANACGFVTLSAGVAAIVPTASTGIEALYCLADAGLYLAKHGGRDRVRDAQIAHRPHTPSCTEAQPN